MSSPSRELPGRPVKAGASGTHIANSPSPVIRQLVSQLGKAGEWMRDRNGKAVLRCSYCTGARDALCVPVARGKRGKMSGRPPLPVIENRRKLAALSPVAIENVRRIMADPEHSEHLKASIWAYEAIQGRATQRIENSADDGVRALLLALADKALGAGWNVIDAASRELPPAVSEADATDAVLPAGDDV
jgi:hypothetical protein